MQNYNQFIPTRLKEGKLIAKYYEENISKDKELNARTLWTKDTDVDFNFFEGLFHKVKFSPKSMSILDLYCGYGTVFDFAQHKHFKIGRYVGLDIVKEFVEHTQTKLPKREIKQINFIDPTFNPDQNFDIVTCFGPLLHKVSHQKEYIYSVINKALQFTKKYALFNIITNITEDSDKNKNKDKIGSITDIDEKIIIDVLKEISKNHKIDVKLHKGKIFNDTTEAFIQIEVLNFEERFLAEHMKYFKEYAIDGVEPDRIIFDTEEWDHKTIWFNKPKNFDKYAIVDPKKPKWWYYIKNNIPCYPVIVWMYEHKEKTSWDNEALDIRIGSEADANMQKAVSLKKEWKRLPIDNPKTKIA